MREFAYTSSSGSLKNLVLVRPAILVRNHGIFFWGPTWEKTKVQAECIEYLLEVAVKMKQHGMEPISS